MLFIILFITIHFIQTALLYLVMIYPLFRAVYKEIAKIDKKDTFLAQAIRKNVKTHVATFYNSKERISKKIKKQEDHQLLSTFLHFLKLVNLPHQHKGYIARFKLVEMVLGLNCEVDEHFNLRKNQKSIEIKFLTQYEQYLKLSTKDKEFVQSIIRKVFQGEETYNHPNLTSFFQDQKANYPEQNKHSESTPQKYQLDSSKRQYLEKVIKGEVSGVSKQIIKIYSQILNNKCNEKSNFDMILQSYEQSNYILLDFDDLTIKK